MIRRICGLIDSSTILQLVKGSSSILPFPGDPNTNGIVPRSPKIWAMQDVLKRLCARSKSYLQLESSEGIFCNFDDLNICFSALHKSPCRLLR